MNTKAKLAALMQIAAFGAMASTIMFKMEADRRSCVYEVGETALISVLAVDTNGVKLTEGKFSYRLDNFGAREILSGEADLSDGNPFVVKATRETPGFVRLRVDPKDKDVQVERAQGREARLFGVAFSPEKVRPGAPLPPDFKEFWDNAIRNLDETVPVDAKMELVEEKSKGDCNYYRVSFATYGGRRVYGWLSEPKDLSKKYPVQLNVPGAGIGASGTGMEKGRIFMTMNVHSYQQPEGKENDAARKAVYVAQEEKYAKPNGVDRYCHAGLHKSREEYFYYASILGINRAFNWLASRPECDLTDFTYGGTSQGGGFGLYMTALNKHITKSTVFVPALTDLLGSDVEERQSGWPNIIAAQKSENRDAARKWAPYFDGANFARFIEQPIVIVVGLADTICPPAGGYSAYNVCPSKDKHIWLGTGMGHGVFRDYYSLAGAWQRDKAPEKRMGSYRFLSFNVWGEYFGNPVEERDLREGLLIKSWDADFVGFQEVTDWGGEKGFWNSRLFSSITNEYEVIGRGMGPKGKSTYDPIAYKRDRFDLVDKGSNWFCEELDRSKGVV